MKTLKEIVIEARCRKGPSFGTTSRGAYWLCGGPIEIGSGGGDGIGNSGARITITMQLRHFRSGEAQAWIHRHAWHQNGSWGGAGDAWMEADEILGATTIEEVVAALYRLSDEHPEDAAPFFYLDDTKAISGALAGIGLPAALPAPDESP